MNTSVVSLGRKAAAAAAVLGLLAASAPVGALAAAPLTVTFTSTAPTQPASTAQNPIPVTATFSEAVADLTASDVSVSNGSIVDFASSSDSVYTFGIVPAAPSGSVSVDMSAGVVTGVDSQTNQAAPQLQFIFDPNAGDAATTTATTTDTIATSTATTTAFLALSTYSGPPGASLNALGTSFDSGEQVDVAFGGATTTVSADGSGNFTLPLVVPDLDVGPAALTATGETSGLVAGNSFFVEPAATTTATTTDTTATSTETSATSTSDTSTTTTAPAPVVVASSGGGGGGGIVGSGPLSVGYVNTNPYGTSPIGAPTVPTQTSGQVLGASAYNFTKPLLFGSRGADVIALQAFLINAGFSIPAGPTGYFGTQTRAAVTAYQMANGLPAVGVVGPLTRALLNRG